MNSTPSVDTSLSGLVPSIPDTRDYRYIPPTGTYPTIKAVDLRKDASPVQDQGHWGACVTNSLVSGAELWLDRAAAFVDLSRAFPYWLGRHLEGRDGQEGMQIRDGLRIANHCGLPTETTWPYDAAHIDLEPPLEVYTEATQRKLDRYELIYGWWADGTSGENYRRITLGIQSALAEGIPVQIGVRLGKTFAGLAGPLGQQHYSAIGAENPYWGNHAMLAVGYTDASPYGLIVENSWGTGWGDGGYGLIGWNVLSSDLFEAWALRGFGGLGARAPAGILLRELSRTYCSVRVAVDKPARTNVYIGAVVPPTAPVIAGQVDSSITLLKRPDGGWRPLAPGDPITPAVAGVQIDDEYEAIVVDGINLAAYAGTKILVAQGADPITWKIAQVCTIPAVFS